MPQGKKDGYSALDDVIREFNEVDLAELRRRYDEEEDRDLFPGEFEAMLRKLS